MRNFHKHFIKSLLVFLFAIQAFSQETGIELIQEVTSEQIQQVKDALGDGVQTELLNNEYNKDDESLDNKDSQVNYRNLSGSPFGYNFISTSPTTISATSDLPVPNDYIISLGDKLGIMLSGSKSDVFEVNINLDGTIFFPDLGPVSVVGQSLKEVRSKLESLVNQAYIGVEIDVSLVDLAARKIVIVGAVNSPGTYLVNPFTTISNALAYSGGIQSIGSLRNIKLLRTNGKTYYFDLYDLLIDGNREQDINVESGDVIIIGPAEKFIEISGEVKRPGIYEINEGENLEDLINFALGYKGSANKQKITLSKLNPENNSIIKIITQNEKHSLDNIISIQVYPYLNNNRSDILVSGAIMEPGYYNLSDYATLEELINRLDFVNVYPWLAVLEQFDEDNLVKSSTLFSLKDPNTYKSVKLLPNSKVTFGNINSRSFGVDSTSKELINDYTLNINYKGRSIKLPVFGKYKLNEFVDFLGLDMHKINPEATYISPLDSLVIKDNYKKMEFVSKKYHTITFRSPVNDLISVKISGAIDYPGTYTLESDATVQDLYKLIGNFKSEAFIDGIIFKRESVRKRQSDSIKKSREDLQKALLMRSQDINSVNAGLTTALSQTIDPENLGRIAGDFSPESISSIKTILLDGDEIIIPKNPNTINVLGEVLNPIAFEFEKSLTIKKAINNAGGFHDYADKSKVYIIKANGLIQRSSKNIFVNSRLNLGPGDTIVVPRKIITNNPGIEALIPLTTVLSDLAFSAAALESLSNN